MKIKNIKFGNFKCFDEVDIDLNDFNVLIGPNASGKTNFVQILKFLYDLESFGLEDAISLQAGVRYFRNLNIGFEKDFFVETTISDEKFFIRRSDSAPVGLMTKEQQYRLQVRFYKRGGGYKVERERITSRVEAIKIQEKKGGQIEPGEMLSTGVIAVDRKGKKVFTEISDSLKDSIDLETHDILPSILENRELGKTEIILNSPYTFFPAFIDLFGDIKVYDFDPKLPKKSIPIAGKKELESDGSNVAVILKEIIARREKKRRFTNYLKDMLSFIDDVNVEKLADKSLIIKAKEKFFDTRTSLPASVLSDGTINITLLIIALFFQENDALSVFEEPDSSIHPSLMSRLISLMKEASNEKQVVITTHNPEILKYVDHDDLLLITRDAQGRSSVIKPADLKSVETFLENELGIEELFVKNLINV